MIPRWLSAWLVKPAQPIEIEPYNPVNRIMEAAKQMREFNDRYLAQSYANRYSPDAAQMTEVLVNPLDYMNAAYRPVSTAASTLGKHGAKVRADKARAKIRAKCDEMNAALGRQPITWP